MKPSVVIFDFDGTIADTFEYLFLIGNMMAKEFDFEGVTPDEMDAFKDKTIRQAMQTLGVPILKLPAILIRGLKEMHLRIEDVSLIAGIQDVLLQLHAQKIKMGVVSTNTKENIDAVLNRYNLAHVFDFVFIGSGMLGKPRALKKAIQRHAISDDHILYVADEVRDIEASRQVGIAIASVSWGFNSAKILQTYQPDYLVHTPRELLSVLT